MCTTCILYLVVIHVHIHNKYTRISLCSIIFHIHIPLKLATLLLYPPPPSSLSLSASLTVSLSLSHSQSPRAYSTNPTSHLAPSIVHPTSCLPPFDIEHFRLCCREMSIDMCERTYIYIHMYINYWYLFSQAEFSCVYTPSMSSGHAKQQQQQQKTNKYGAHMCRKRLTVICEGKQTQTRRTHTHKYTDTHTYTCSKLRLMSTLFGK